VAARRHAEGASGPDIGVDRPRPDSRGRRPRFAEPDANVLVLCQERHPARFRDRRPRPDEATPPRAIAPKRRGAPSGPL